MFRRLDGGPPAAASIVFRFEDSTIVARTGDTVASALLAAGVRRFREAAIDGAGRAPYCMMGVCFECLVEIDGKANRQACLTPVRQGMCVRMQRGARAVT
jgi:predicted molibdopterin-dependent oxidoreductase YjgC